MIDEKNIDPGIKQSVRLMETLGFKVTDCGDGTSRPEVIAAGGALPYPSMVVESSHDTCVSDLDTICEHLTDQGIKLGPLAEDLDGLVAPFDEHGNPVNISGDGVLVHGEFYRNDVFFIEVSGLDDALLAAVASRLATNGR